MISFVSATHPKLREADGQRSQLVVVQVQMLKVDQIPQVVRQTGQLVFTQIHLDQVGQVAKLWLRDRNPAGGQKKISLTFVCSTLENLQVSLMLIR